MDKEFEPNEEAKEMAEPLQEGGFFNGEADGGLKPKAPAFNPAGGGHLGKAAAYKRQLDSAITKGDLVMAVGLKRKAAKEGVRL